MRLKHQVSEDDNKTWEPTKTKNNGVLVGLGPAIFLLTPPLDDVTFMWENAFGVDVVRK